MIYSPTCIKPWIFITKIAKIPRQIPYLYVLQTIEISDNSSLNDLCFPQKQISLPESIVGRFWKNLMKHNFVIFFLISLIWARNLGKRYLHSSIPIRRPTRNSRAHFIAEFENLMFLSGFIYISFYFRIFTLSRRHFSRRNFSQTWNHSPVNLNVPKEK